MVIRIAFVVNKSRTCEFEVYSYILHRAGKKTNRFTSVFYLAKFLNEFRNLISLQYFSLSGKGRR